jgi:hypothetical protein
LDYRREPNLPDFIVFQKYFREPLIIQDGKTAKISGPQILQEGKIAKISGRLFQKKNSVQTIKIVKIISIILNPIIEHIVISINLVLGFGSYSA